MTKPAIRIEGLGKSYRLTQGQQREGYRTLRESIGGMLTSPFRRRGIVEDFWALDNVSFEVHPGEVVGVIGRNGAGKSTLLKLISRITKPTRGHIEINGRVGSLLEVGTGFHPELTGRENVYLNGSILGMTRHEISAKFNEIVAFAEVEKFLDMPVKRYSSGMYVRLAFAVAAHLEPEILIIDEVLAVGDAAFQKKCLEKIKTCARSGLTIILVTHQIETVREMCSLALWLEKGRLRDKGHPLKISDSYIGETGARSLPGVWKNSAESTGVLSQTKILGARFFGEQESDHPLSGREFNVELKFKSDADNPGDIKIEMQISNKHEVKLICVNTIELRTPLKIQKGHYHLAFKIDRLYLNPGEYSLHFHTGDAEDLHHVLRDFLRFEVVPDGQDYLPGYSDPSIVLRNCSISINKSDTP